MSRTHGYSTFARFYDSLTTNVNYSTRAARLHDLILHNKTTSGNLLLDLACGTGSLSEEMARLGYDVLGVDCSPEMLGCAMDKKFESGLPIQYLCQDMRELDMFGTIDITLCMLDSLNHLDSLADIVRVFERVSLFAEPGGLFLFDMNTPYKHEAVLADNTLVLENESVYCVWSNRFHKPDVDITLEFFEKEFDHDGELYRRSTECFRERAYDASVIDTALADAGFAVLAHYDGDGAGEASVRPDSERILFIARKKEN